MGGKALHMLNHTEHEKILRQVAERLGLEIGAVRPKRPPLEAGLAINVEELRAALAEAERELKEAERRARADQAAINSYVAIIAERTAERDHARKAKPGLYCIFTAAPGMDRGRPFYREGLVTLHFCEDCGSAVQTNEGMLRSEIGKVSEQLRDERYRHETAAQYRRLAEAERDEALRKLALLRAVAEAARNVIVEGFPTEHGEFHVAGQAVTRLDLALVDAREAGALPDGKE